MKKAITILILVTLNGCGLLKDRNVEITKDKIHYLDRSVIETTSPGDKVFITIPATPNTRPKETTVRYDGDKGAKTDVTFDKDGTVTSISSDCPEVNEREERDIEFQRQTKLKDIDSQFNLELADKISSTIIWCSVILGFFGSIAWVARAYVTK